MISQSQRAILCDFVYMLSSDIRLTETKGGWW